VLHTYEIEEIRPFVVAIHTYNINSYLNSRPNAKRRYDQIVDKIYDLQKISSGRKLSNVGGWQSDSIDESLDFMSDVEQVVTDIATHIHNISGVHGRAEINNYWFNINKKHDHNTSHTHPFSSLSACLYLKAPENCGAINFERPQLSGINDYADDPNEYTWSRYTFTPVDGTILFFPSTIRHYVAPNQSDHDRISVAFNFKKAYK